MNKNFLNLIIGRTTKNLADSFLFIFMTIALFNKGTIYSTIFLIVQGCAEVIAIFAGNVIDRYFIGLRAKLLGMQVVQSILAIIIFGLLFIDADHSVFVLVLFYLAIFLFYIINPLSYASENTIMPRIVDKKFLAKGYSIMSATGQLTDMVFNAISGVIIVLTSFAHIFVITIASFFTGVIAYQNISMDEQTDDLVDEQVHMTWRDIPAFFLKDETGVYLITSIIHNFSFALIYVSYPLWAQTIDLNMSTEIYGLLIATGGIGMFVGSLVAPYVKKDRLVMLSFTLTIVGWLLLAFVYKNLLLVVICQILNASGSGLYNNYLYTMLGEKEEASRTKEQRFIIMETLSSLIMPVGYALGGGLAIYLSLGQILFVVAFLCGINFCLYMLMKKRTTAA
jgi:hypothetical protein